jgi:ABC-type dipeptide/oligopeptide/nickel transport system permease component
VLRRLLHAFFVVLALSLVVFLLGHAVGNPVYLLVPPDATAADVDRLTHELGLDRPLYEQYALFVTRAIQGDFGESFRHRAPALPLALSYLPATLQLAAVAFMFTIVIAVPLGLVSAIKRNSPIDHGVRVVSLVGQAMPTFWFGLILILVFSVQLRWLPASGYGHPANIIMPALALGYASAASVARLLRSSVLEVLRLDYVRTARAKGLRRWAVLARHALPNAALPVVTILGLEVGRLLGGAIVTETIFAWPGIGQFLIQGVANLDFPVVQATVMVIAVMLVLVNLGTDLLYVAIDPRIRLD